ncbi:MAG: histidine phosphatase family protein [Rhodomicrobium sp.]|nr:histidine phosphatase family protein [Rhodomicrobium sp.]
MPFGLSPAPVFRGILPKWPAILFAASLLAVAVLPARGASSAEDLWNALRQPDHFALMRHATAPGTGDPDNFRLGDCSTQRNLSQGGREQARRTGEAFRAKGLSFAAVYSSAWCRCLDTARLLGFGEPQVLASLNSFFEDRSAGPAQTRRLRSEIQAMDLSRPVMFVTHQVNVTALSGVYPRSGEIVVMRRMPGGGLETLGSLRP